MANYATADNMIERYSAGLLGDLVSDDGIRVQASILSLDQKMIAALATASGLVKAHLRQADRYTDEMLEGVSDSGSDYYDVESAAMLADITCRIAFWKLWRRKPWSDAHENSMKQAEDDYNEVMDMLRKGVIILNIDSAATAGKPDSIGIKATQLKTMWSQIGRGRFYPTNKNTTTS